MLTKRDLGVGYLLGTGLGLIVALVGYFLLAGEPMANTMIAVGSAILLSCSLLYVGYWLYGSELSGDLVWRVAQYSSAGLSVPVAIGVLLTVVGVRPALAYLFPSLFINTIAAGAVIGLLFGSVRELRREHLTAIKLNQRNSVLNRVLRHNLRVDELIAISESARRIERIEDGSAGGPIDLASLVAERVELYEATRGDVAFDLELPEEAWAGVGPLCKSAIDNLIENAIEHTFGDSTIRIAVGSPRDAGDTVEVVVADDGPGIPSDEIQALDGNGESPLHHGSGLGLWVAKWVTESNAGEIEFDENERGGSVVTLRFPAASRVDRLLGTA